MASWHDQAAAGVLGMTRAPLTTLCALVLGASLLVSAVPVPQDRQPTFRAGVDVVVLDVLATDDHGIPVHGLTRDDFTVREDGDVQRVLDVSEVVLPSPARESAG